MLVIVGNVERGFNMKRSKYKIKMEMLSDNCQTQFTEIGIKQNDSPLARITTVNYAQKVFCPFCLHKDSLRNFVVNKRLGNCPECENNMLITTLLRMLKWTPKEYAIFVYEYPFALFWSKCSNVYEYPFALFWSKCSNKFELWKNRLHNLNMSYEFWEIYKYLKEQREGL